MGQAKPQITMTAIKESTRVTSVRNKTLRLSANERALFAGHLKQLASSTKSLKVTDLIDTVLWGDSEQIAGALPNSFVDLLILDPPYNLTKTFGDTIFTRKNIDAYTQWFDVWFSKIKHVLKPDASLYVCGDWMSSPSIFQVLSKHVTVRNRITWEREKGRGARANWKNNSEDIWFATMHPSRYYFDVDAVKMKRKVIAPYTTNGAPKDWKPTVDGNFRLTHPSNIWTDISVPFWSMDENTAHPTQKPEKLLAKLILASSQPDQMIFDPFLGSGTTAVVAQKLGRRFFRYRKRKRILFVGIKTFGICPNRRNHTRICRWRFLGTKHIFDPEIS